MTVTAPELSRDEVVGRSLDRVLVAGQTCWQTAQADRFAPIIDGADYLSHVKSAMLQAKHRIMLIGWDLDHRVEFEPGGATMPGPNQLALFLHWLAWQRRPLRTGRPRGGPRARRAPAPGSTSPCPI